MLVVLLRRLDILIRAVSKFHEFTVKSTAKQPTKTKYKMFYILVITNFYDKFLKVWVFFG